jgi:predicted molibdopterin-dependent oxidoreductase YjgC
MDYQLVPSICSYCGTGCGILFRVVNGRITGTWPMKDHPVNEGKLCIKGWNMHDVVNSDMRLKHPLVKLNGRFQRATWDKAIGYAAGKFKEVIQEHGPESVGVLVSAKVTNEENYLAMKMARAALGTNNVDHCARL